MKRKLTPEARQNIANAQHKRRGWKHTPESIEKIRETHLGERNAMYGKTHSEEVKKRMSESHKRKVSEFTRLKMSVAQKNRFGGTVSMDDLWRLYIGQFENE